MRYRTRRIIIMGIGFFLTGALLWIQFLMPPVLGELTQRLELITFDIRLKTLTSAARQSTAKVVIIDIDDRSLAKYGRWPWSRSTVATLIENIFHAGAAVVALDIMFSEPETNPVTEVVEYLKNNKEHNQDFVAKLAKLETDMDHDHLFANTLRNKEVILGYTFLPYDRQQIGSLPRPLELTNPQKIINSTLADMHGYTANLPTLNRAASGCGFFSLIPDIDGVVRRAPLIARYNNKLFSSLALETVRNYMLIDKITLSTSLINNLQAIEGISLDGFTTLPTDANGQMVIPYIGTKGSFPYIPAHEILTDTATLNQLEGAIVLIGTTAPGLFDLRAIPLQAVYPGVEIHANLIDAILNKHFLQRPTWATGADFVVMVITGMFLALWLPFLSATRQIIWSIIVVSILMAGNILLWQHGLILSLAMPLILTGLLTAGNLAHGFLFESRARQQLKNMFGQYVPPQIVQQMSENQHQYGFDGETREMTVLFADIRGFTTLSENLNATELKKLLNRYFTPMTKIIFQTNGTIDKYVGDMVMAFWGAPLHDEQHATHAIKAAFLMLEETKKLSDKFIAEGLPEIAVGIGINSGSMNVGDMGSEFRRSYTVLGDAVNLGSRLEGSTKYYGIDLLVGAKTMTATSETFTFREIDLVRVKGKSQAIKVYEPVGYKDKADENTLAELQSYHACLGDYRAQNWEKARSGFNHLSQTYGNRHIYDIYLQRIATLAINRPGSDWDGVYTRAEK